MIFVYVYLSASYAYNETLQFCKKGFKEFSRCLPIDTLRRSKK
jgi:hypothetical protein